MKLCDCGCGKEVSSDKNRFIHGHNRDTYDQKLVCIICSKKCSNNRFLSNHITKTHKIALKNYYDDFLKKETEGFCKLCGKESAFTGLKFGYRKYCSLNCMQSDPYIINQKKLTSLKIYNVDNPSKSEIIKEKKSKTISNHDIEKRKEIHNSLLKSWNNKTDDELEKINTKRIKTNRERSGFDHSSQNPETREKARQTNLNIRGVENPMQDPVVQEKSLKNSFRKKKYILPSGKEILLQGEEPQFLDFVFSNDLLKESDFIFYPKGIKYINEGKSHYYFPDFLIVPFNLIVEVKSSWILKIQHCTNLKISATRALGYNYVMILDKKYDEFKTLVSQLSEQIKNLPEGIFIWE